MKFGTYGLAVCLVLSMVVLVTSVSTVHAIDNPSFSSLSIVSNIDSANVYWYIDHNGENQIKVACTLNSYTCEFIGYRGSGGCSMQAADLYVFTLDPASPEKVARTVPNLLSCEAYNASLENPQPDQKDFKSTSFYPFAFQLSIPSGMSLTVGYPQVLGMTIKNNGTITDQYQVSISTNQPTFLVIESANQLTEPLLTKHAQQIYSDILMLTSEASPNLVVTVTSLNRENLKIENLVLEVRGGYVSLPDIGSLGVLQIIVLAVILATFLF